MAKKGKKKNKTNKNNKQNTQNVKKSKVVKNDFVEKTNSEGDNKSKNVNENKKEEAKIENKTLDINIQKSKNEKNKSSTSKEKNKKTNESKKEEKDKNEKSSKEKSKEDIQKDSKKVEENKKSKKENKKIKETKKTEKQELKEDKKDSTKKEKKQKNSKTELEKPEYVVDEEKRKKVLWRIFIIIICIAMIVMVFSTIFAFLNLNSTTIAKGVFVKNIELSNLTEEEAKNKLNEALNIELNVILELEYQDFKTTLETSQIEYSYQVEDAIKEAYGIGRNKSLIENNYDLLKAGLFEENLNIKSNYNEEALDYIINDLSTRIPGLVQEPSYYIEGEELIIEKGIDGVVVDTEALKSEILKDIENRDANQIKENTANRKITIPVIEKKASAIDIDKIYSEVYREPKDAYYEENPFKIYKEEEGIDFAISVDEAKQKISSEDASEYRIPLKLTPADKTINDIGTEAFPYLISKATTRYDATNINRSKNLQISTNKINGTVLMPGETFSFNKVVGKRTIEEGYKDAIIYENGKAVDGLAGGICQISSTLYNAVLEANLEIVERSNHSFTTSYVPAGKDATVVYGVKDFQFKNSRNYPIKIEGSVASGIVTFKIHGIKEEVEYEVKIVPRTTSTIPYTTQTIQDSSLAPGQQVVEQTGHAGYKVTTYKQLWLNGKMVSNELLSNDTYKPMQAIIRVGP